MLSSSNDIRIQINVSTATKETNKVDIFLVIILKKLNLTLEEILFIKNTRTCWGMIS